MVKRFFQRAYHLWERIVRETKHFPKHYRNFGFKVARSIWWDGLIPPGKSSKYIQVIEECVDRSLEKVLQTYDEKSKEIDENGCLDKKNERGEKTLVWCCWWQGEESMPELVKMCNKKLQSVLPKEKTEYHLITLENYKDYVTIPKHIMKKFHEKKITMTTLSDILRFQLLSKYGGLWIDSTVFITGDFPEVFFRNEYFSQKMKNIHDWEREACKGRWCGFLMAGPSHHIIFEYMNAAFTQWWLDYDDIPDYVLIDYILLSGYKHIPAIRSIIDNVSPNNEHVFRMYGLLNNEYSDELNKKLTSDTTFHKLTYKMDLQKETETGKLTLYGYLLKQVGM